MKKWKILFPIVCLMLTMVGCGVTDQFEYVEDENQIDGASWTTWGYYHHVDWFTPEGTDTIWAYHFTDPSGIRFNKDTEEYIEICEVYLHESNFTDSDYIYDTLVCEDFNGDGYGDVAVSELDGDKVYQDVFVWNQSTKSFETDTNLSGYVEDYSSNEEKEPNSDSETDTDSEENLSTEELIVKYYEALNNPKGNYVVFDNENVETEDTIEYILRYQPSDEEEEEMIENGSGPVANIYVLTITENKKTGEFTDENGAVIDLNNN